MAAGRFSNVSNKATALHFLPLFNMYEAAQFNSTNTTLCTGGTHSTLVRPDNGLTETQ